jgi:cell division protein FtsW
MRAKPFDKIFFISVVILVLVGFFIFASASMGLLARESGASFEKVLLKQLVVGIILGSGLLYGFSLISYRVFRKHALYILIGSLFATALVFVPHLGFTHGGATRWLAVGPITFQPAEFLKIGFVIFFAAWLSGVKDKVTNIKQGIIPFAVIIGICGALLIKQPDTGTFIVIAITGLSMLIAAGVPWKHVLGLIGIGILTLAILVMIKPYLKDRLMTFLDPNRDPTGASYQIQQSLIAVGSGGFAGKGFGQSVQKFNFLPEPIGDSVFAVFAEEWGLLGGIVLLIMFLFFASRGIHISATSPDLFGGLLALGIVILIVTQSFINIASMLGIFPITGMPLLFVSHGGSALLFAMAEVGILLNISRQRKGI